MKMESLVCRVPRLAYPLAFALTLTLGCKLEQQECTTDADCGADSYCETNLGVCFGIPQTSQPQGVATDPPSPSNNPNPRLFGVAEKDATIYIYDEPTCQSLYLARVTPTSEGNFEAVMQVAPGETKSFYTVAEKVRGHPTPCTLVYTYVHDISSPAVVSCPGDDQKPLSTTEPVKVTFSEPIAGSTLNDTTLVFKDGAEVVKGTYDVDGPTVTFTPEKALGFKKSYTLSVTSGVQDLATNPVSAKQCQFRTETTRWTAPQSVGIAQNANNIGLSFALSPSGTVFLGWTEGNDPDFQVWAGWQVAGGAFERKQLASPAPRIGPPALAIDASGNALYAWHQGGHLFYQHYWAAGGWEPSSLQLDAPGETGYPLDVALSMSGSGHSTALWTLLRDENVVMQARRFGQGWATDIEPVTSASLSLDNIRLASEPDGKVIALFCRDGQPLEFARRTPQWVNGGVLEDSVYTVSEPALASGSFAGAAWLTGGVALRARLYSATEGWHSNILKFYPVNGDLAFPSLAVGAGGHAWVAFARGGNFIHAWRHHPSTQWDDSYQDVIAAKGATEPRVAVDKDGNAVVVWLQEGETLNPALPIRQAWARRYYLGQWEDPQRLASSNSDACCVSVGFTNDGTAVAAWLQEDMVRQVWVARLPRP